MRVLYSILCTAFPFLLLAQFAPRAGRSGSTAIHKDSSSIVAWANSCQVVRGWVDISQPDSGKTSVGTDSLGAGKADGSSVSLGDGGIALLTFNPPLVNGPGADFAVFENGFNIRTANDSDFLELGFVEVSSDGIHFFRFDAVSANDTNIQLRTFDGMKATTVHNFAGKYTNGYGTPFDLGELAPDALLDVNHITHIRVIDVIGGLNDSFATRDSKGNKVNDPWPTPFPQGGFDLDAVAVIHNVDFPNHLTLISQQPLQLYPNPVKAGEILTIIGMESSAELFLTASDGKTLKRVYDNGINTSGMAPGLYYLRINTGSLTVCKSILIL